MLLNFTVYITFCINIISCWHEHLHWQALKLRYVQHLLLSTCTCTQSVRDYIIQYQKHHKTSLIPTILRGGKAWEWDYSLVNYKWYILSRRRLWETEIIKGSCIKEFQAVPFDVSFLEHMVFIHWSVVVGVLQKREWTDKRQNIKIGGSVLLKYLCWLSTSTSYLAWQATLFAERGRVWSHCNHWFFTMAETWCDQRDLCFRRLHNFCCHGVFWYSNYVTMDVTIYCADCMTTRQRQYDHPLSVSAKGVACETTSYPGLHPSISYSTRVPGKCITCNKWWKKPWVRTRLVAQWVPGYTEMVTQVWEHRHVIQTYILTAISNSVFSGCVLLVKTPIKVLENASTSPPNGTKYNMLQCSNLMKHW